MRNVFFVPLFFLFLFSSVAGRGFDGGDDVYEAPDPEPTPEETLILEYINRFRADPAAEADRIAPLDGSVATIGLDQVKVDVFRSELKELSPSPPLVFDLALVRSARRHSHYQVLNGQCYNEDPDKPGYTGYDSGERAHDAGYGASNRQTLECSYDEAEDIWHAYTVDIVCYGLVCDETGMTHDRHARVINHDPSGREFGCGYLRGKKNFTVTKVFAEGSGKRFSGGVAYVDENRNGFYDIGEGRGGVIISCGDAIVESWKSGAYTLPIGEGMVTITAQFDRWNGSRTFEPGRDNVKFDFLIPKEEDVKKALRLLTAAEKEKNRDRRFNALLDLHRQAQDLVLDEKTRARIESLTAPVISRLDSAKKEVRDAFGAGDMRQARKIVFSRKKEYSRTMASRWFDDAERCSRQKEKYDQLAAFKREGKRLSESRISKVVRTMRKEEGKLETAEWKRWLSDLADRANDL